MYIKSVIGVILVYCTGTMSMQFERDEEVPLISLYENPIHPVELDLTIETAKKEYRLLSFLRKYFCSPQERGPEEKLKNLRREKKEYKKNQENYYGDISNREKYPIVLDNQERICTLSAPPGDAPLLTGFSKLGTLAMNTVTNIRINNTKLQVLPLGKFIEYFQYLDNLDVSKNEIDTITYASSRKPYEIAKSLQHGQYKWDGLQTLDLSHNKMEFFDVGSLFIACPHIQHIYLGNNSNLSTILLEGPVPSKIIDANKGSGYLWRYQLPFIHAENTQLSAAKEKIKAAYIKAMIEARALSNSTWVGFSSCSPGVLLALNAVSHTPLFVPFDVGIAVAASSVIIGTSIGYVLGRYVIDQKEKDVMDVCAEQHLCGLSEIIT